MVCDLFAFCQGFRKFSQPNLVFCIKIGESCNRFQSSLDNREVSIKNMGITVHWDDPKLHIVRYEFDAHWDWADLFAATQEDDELVADHDHFHLILDMRAVKAMPPNPTVKLRKLAEGVGAAAQLSLIVLVGQSRWAETILDIFYRVYGAHTSGIGGVDSVQTLEEARALIAEYEASRV